VTGVQTCALPIWSDASLSVFIDAVKKTSSYGHLPLD
jgi:hypothetical protein